MLAAMILGAASAAHAAPLPLEEPASLGLPIARVQIRIATEGADTRIRVSTGRHTSEAVVRGVTDRAEIERVVLSNGAAVAVIRAEGSARVAALVVVRRGRPEVIWSARLDLHGDPGERVGASIETADRSGDGHPDVVVGQLREGVGPCGQPPALLFPRALDPGGELRPVVLRRLAEGEEVAVVASATSPGPTGAPLIRALSVAGVTSTAGIEEDARLLEAPRALTDGDPATSWAEGRGGAGDGEMIVARFGAGIPIRAFAITPARDEGTRAPQALLIAGESGARLRVTLPETTGRLWIVPPAPLAWSCFAIALADAGGAAGARTAIAEIEVFTELDFGGGLDAMVAELVRGDDTADRTAELLSRLGEPAVVALDAAWDRLGARGRERAARVAAGGARAGNEPSLTLLARAAGDDAAEVRTAGITGLSRAGAPGRARLAGIAGEPGAAGDDAAGALAALEASFPIAPLLEAMSREGGSERASLRAALARGAALGGSEAEAALSGWAGEASVAARASAAIGLAEDGRTRGLAVVLVERSLEGATTFVDRFRLATAAARIGAGSEAIDGWLGALASGAEEWMLRQAAVVAVGRRSPAIARAALADPYPRVRVAAIERLATSAPDRAALTASLREDRWPLVRVAALDAVADAESARAALEDDAQIVRQRAIEHLARLGDRSAWPAIELRLRDDDEWPIVTEASLGYVESLCLPEASEALAVVIQRGTRPSAWEPDVQLAVGALRVALRIGGATADDARTVAARGGEALQAALAQTAPEPCGR